MAVGQCLKSLPRRDGPRKRGAGQRSRNRNVSSSHVPFLSHLCKVASEVPSGSALQREGGWSMLNAAGQGRQAGGGGTIVPSC